MCIYIHSVCVIHTQVLRKRLTLEELEQALKQVVRVIRKNRQDYGDFSHEELLTNYYKIIGMNKNLKPVKFGVCFVCNTQKNNRRKFVCKYCTKIFARGTVL